jgi:hypothetical protein
LPTPKVNNRLFTFWTPAYVDARVSTDKITESTLAQNRIVYGSDFELRAYRADAASILPFTASSQASAARTIATSTSPNTS